MKKVFIMSALLVSVIGFSQEKWRTLTFGNNVGTTYQGHTFDQVSASLDYELGKKFSISSWNGLNYNFHSNRGWYSSLTTIDRKFGKGFTVGTGLQVGSGTGPGSVFNEQTDLYFIVKCQYRIKL